MARPGLRLGLVALFLLALGVTGPYGIARASLLDDQRYPASGERLLLWVSSERGRDALEASAAEALSAAGVAVWSLDPSSSYFLPQLPRSMDTIPAQDVANWIRTALASGKTVTVYAVARSAVPVLRALTMLQRSERTAICVILMYPNLYSVAEPLAEPDYLVLDALEGATIRVLQPRRSAATPWLSGLVETLRKRGAAVNTTMLENLRERFWARETPTEFEIAEGRRLDALLQREMESCGNR